MIAAVVHRSILGIVTYCGVALCPQDDQKNTAHVRVYPHLDELVTRADALVEQKRYAAVVAWPRVPRDGLLTREESFRTNTNLHQSLACIIQVHARVQGVGALYTLDWT